MSMASISSNQAAIGYINDAIKEYQEAIKKIEQDNENKLSDELIKEIEDTIGYLEGLKGNLGNLNAEISRELAAKAERERERKLREEKQ